MWTLLTLQSVFALPQIRERTETFFAPQVHPSQLALIGCLANGHLDTHSALVLEQTFGCVGNVIGASQDLAALAASSIDDDRAHLLQQFVAKNKVIPDSGGVI